MKQTFGDESSIFVENENSVWETSANQSKVQGSSGACQL